MDEYEETLTEYQMALRDTFYARESLLEATAILEKTNKSIPTYEAKLRQLRRNMRRG
jgi:hypothetical protein